MKKPRYFKHVFPNGLTLLIEPHREYRSLSMGVFARVGTRDESASVAGASHFLEHMLFKGTKNRTALDIAREVDRVGGDFNAYTTREYTCFHLLMLDRDLNLGIDILSDILLRSTFAKEEFERERKVILQEIFMVEDNPEELLFDKYLEWLYGRDPLGKPILGTGSSIKKMKRAAMMKFFYEHYTPENIIFSVAGDVDPAQVKRALSPLGKGRWPERRKRTSVNRVPSLAPGPQVKPGLWWQEKKTEQAHLAWGVPGLPYGHPDRFAMLLLNVYLGSGMSSRLFQEIREKAGLAYTVYSSVSSFRDSGLFTVYAATSPAKIPLCIRLIEESVARLEKELLTDDELKMIQDHLKGTILLASDDVESRMSSIAKNEMFLGRYHSPEEVCRRVEQVRAEDIRRLARKLFARDRSIGVLGPAPSPKLLSALPFRVYPD